ncbi:MAG TPA: polysaccharide biosynthesis tyrosine autokinase [Gemmatimonadaceae bacterium]|jgi:capsular exopolysaccharide synthesis family protein
MTGNYIPSNLPAERGQDPNFPAFPAQGWPPAWGAANVDEAGIPWGRYFAALRRYKWLIMVLVIVGGAAGIVVTKFLPPEYSTQGQLWINDNGAQRSETPGPVQGDELLAAGAWADLLKSSTIMDRVVKRMSLYIWPAQLSDSAALDGFQPGPGFRAGTYALRVDSAGHKYALLTDQGVQLETGAVGDSVGRTLGFLWKPRPATLGRGHTVQFTVADPRDVAVGLLGRMDVTLPERSAFLKVSMTGRSPRRTAAILNAVMVEFVSTAGELKRRNLEQSAAMLSDQLDTARENLRSAESAYQSFRQNSITLPQDAGPGVGIDPATAAAVGGGNPPGGGVGAPNDPLGGANGAGGNPVIGNYFTDQAQLAELQHDQAALQQLLQNPNSITADAFVPILTARQSPELQGALTEMAKRESELRTAREAYTEEHPTVQALRSSVQVMRTQTIPTILRGLIAQIQSRETDLQGQITTAGKQLKAIPPRTIEQMRLERDVNSKTQLFSMLQARYEEMRLAEASAIPDISILDTAVAPLLPTKNTTPSIIAFAIVASLGGALGLALLLDHTDPRFRYPEQVTSDLGLTILGAVPSIKRARSGEPNPEEAAQVIEAFRTIRMSLTNSYAGSGSIAFAVSSPGPGDGKSLVSSNLALSFAEAGYRTVLVDGDTRRGQLHAMFGANRRPGLLDYLGGDAPLETILRTTTHEKLALIPCGTRRHRGPELLHSQAMLQLMGELRARYDVILIDSPPLGAGVDPFVLGAATGNLLMVLRTGTTDRRMADAKLKLLKRLPIRLLGAVLNDIRAQGVYRYYTYLYGYTTSEDDELPQLAPQVSELSGKN